jgi:hypothetical protein
MINMAASATDYSTHVCLASYAGWHIDTYQHPCEEKVCQNNVRRPSVRKTSTNRCRPRRPSRNSQLEPDDPEQHTLYSIRIVGPSQRWRGAGEEPMGMSLFPTTSKNIGILATEGTPHRLDKGRMFGVAAYPMGQLGLCTTSIDTILLALTSWPLKHIFVFCRYEHFPSHQLVSIVPFYDQTISSRQDRLLPSVPPR